MLHSIPSFTTPQTVGASKAPSHQSAQRNGGSISIPGPHVDTVLHELGTLAEKLNADVFINLDNFAPGRTLPYFMNSPLAGKSFSKLFDSFSKKSHTSEKAAFIPTTLATLISGLNNKEVEKASNVKSYLQYPFAFKDKTTTMRHNIVVGTQKQIASGEEDMIHLSYQSLNVHPYLSPYYLDKEPYRPLYGFQARQNTAWQTEPKEQLIREAALVRDNELSQENQASIHNAFKEAGLKENEHYILKIVK